MTGGPPAAPATGAAVSRPLPRRVGILSDGQHFRGEDGALYTTTPLARQFEQWAALFDEVVVCAPLWPGRPEARHSAYRAPNIRLEPMRPAGGRTLLAKARLAAALPGWIAAIRRMLARVDAVHVRCPNNVSIPGLLLLSRSRHFRQAVYTGNWAGYPGEARTFRWQRLHLRRRFRGPVMVYGRWPGDPSHVVPTFSPVFSDADWEGEAAAVEARVAALRAAPALDAVTMVSVGQLDANKNQRTAVRALALLRARGLGVELHLLGEGERRGALAALAAELGVASAVRFHGQVSHEEVRAHYRRAHFVVQPSYSEGFSKVIVEAQLHGAVPLLSDLPVNREAVGDGTRGRCFPPDDAEGVAAHVAALAADPAALAAMVEAGRAYARVHSLEAWREHLRSTLESHWKVGP